MIKQIKGFLSVLTFVVCSAVSSYGQKVTNVTDKQIEQLIEQIELRGLSEAEVELMAKARGYTETDIAIIKERINRKKTGLGTRTESKNNEIVREQLGELSERVEKEDRTDTLKVREIFGKSLFNNDKITFEPNLRIATPPDYVLGVDDELTIEISGYAVGRFVLKVSNEGTVKLENLAPIYVNGLTVTKAKEKISQRLSSLYAGLRNGSLSLDMVLTKVRTIKVMIIGEVESPGSYSVSSLATVFNALYLSGGPTKNGSFRNIELIRNNKQIRKIDVYDFLMTGSLSNNSLLQDGDVINIPVAETIVELDGEVVRPYRFELKAGEGLSEAIKYAGGFSAKAYTSQLSIERNTNTEKEIISVQESNFSNFLLRKGDKVTIGAILDRYTNRVEVLGAVFRPGVYAIDSNLKTVGDLISRAEGLREDAFIDRAILKRLGKNLDPVLLPLNLDSIRRGYDITLQREDVLIIKSIAELRELRKINISGRVNIPGVYDYVDNMSLNDLIIMAGGLREGASVRRIEISRRINEFESTGKNVEIYNIDIAEGFSSKEGNFLLKPFDIVVIRELPNYQKQEMVYIVGEVNYPGIYSIADRTERISDLIERAGGIRKDAYLRGAQFYRQDRQVAVDVEEVLKNKGKAYNLFLQVGDSLYIPKEKQTVKVMGQVLNPTSVAYQENLGFRDYIVQAGGYTDSAFVRKVYVKYPNGHVDKTKSFLTINIHPKVEKGMEIHVPVKRREKMSKAEVIAVSSGMISVSAVLLTLFRLL